MTAADKHWATLTIALPGGAIEPVALADAADRLEEVGALLAMDPDIDGVQTLLPQYDAVERPALRVYTHPAALARVDADARELVTRHGLAATFTSEVRSDTQWQDVWKQFYRPLLFGEGLFLVRPSWIDRRQDDPELELLLDPGRAFGTGLHPTTQLCIERLCTLRRAGLAPRSLLDLGCGSGILGLSALRLFPTLQHTVAVDVDSEATDTAAENAVTNALADRLELRTGGLEVLGAHERFDVIVANIRPTVLIPMAGALVNHLAPGGHLTLSGILPEEAENVERAYLAAGWSLRNATRVLDGWSGLDLAPPTVSR